MRGAILACALLAMVAPAAAETYPSKPVRIVVGFAAGSVSDLTARTVGQKLGAALGQPFVVEVRPGAGSNVAAQSVVRSPKDGYTLFVATSSSTIPSPATANLGFNFATDLQPIALLANVPFVLTAYPGLGVKTVQEFIALAKAKPGELNYASSGPGTPYHMAGELFKAMTGTDIVHVPHKASGEARNSVIAGHVQMMFDAVTTMMPNVLAGQVRALGTTGLKRSATTPDLPTIAEAGVPGYDATIWLGVMAPAATPKAVVDKLNAEINKVLARPDVIAAWAKQGAEPMAMTPAEFDAYLRKDIEKWAEVVKVSGAKVQ